MPIRLRKFLPYEPLELLKGPIGEWVVLILLCGLFIAIAGAVLPKRFTEGRYGKAVTIIVGLILGVGLFMTRKLYNFNFESFGFLAIFIIIILMFLVTYGLLKMHFNNDMAIGISYCMIFLTFYIMSPSLFDTFANTLPILNGIFFLTFFYIIGKLIYNMLKGTGEGLKEKIKSAIINTEQTGEDSSMTPKQRKALKSVGGNLKMKDATLKSMLQLKASFDNIIKALDDMGGWIDPQQSKLTVKALKPVAQTKSTIGKAFKILTETIAKYKEVDNKLQPQMMRDAQELKDMLHGFYSSLDRGTELISQNAIKPGLPLLKKAQEYLNAAIQVIERIRANEPADVGKNMLWQKE